MFKTLPDNTTIEYVVADSYGGPNNCFSRQNVNSSAVFWRLLEDQNWTPSNHRNLHKFLDWFDCCSCFDDFLASEEEAKHR